MVYKDLTRATGMGFCISQLPLIIFVILYYREPTAIYYTTEISNKTSLDIVVSHEDVGLSVLFLAVSCMIVFFSMMTSQLQDSQLIDNMVEFNEEIAWQVSNWNNLLMGISFFERWIIISLLITPVHIALLICLIVIQTYTVAYMCLPKTLHKRGETLALVIFMITLAFTFIQLHATHGLKLIVMSLQIIADVLLMIGHTYDTVCNMETVANCRIFYCCFVSCLLILLYIA